MLLVSGGSWPRRRRSRRAANVARAAGRWTPVGHRPALERGAKKHADATRFHVDLPIGIHAQSGARKCDA